MSESNNTKTVQEVAAAVADVYEASTTAVPPEAQAQAAQAYRHLAGMYESAAALARHRGAAIARGDVETVLLAGVRLNHQMEMNNEQIAWCNERQRAWLEERAKAPPSMFAATWRMVKSAVMPKDDEQATSGDAAQPPSKSVLEES